MDTVFIHGLEVRTIVGIYAWERELKRPLIFDLELGVDTRAAAKSDQVADAVNYAAVSERVREIALQLQPALLETLAEQIAQLLLAEFAIEQVRISISKPGAVAGVKSVGVRIERSR
ncbi:MAG: dihydroneopterin aldolase [Pseudomonadota bacterium]|nr:dihydroneopterin aldolase [Pseudomonadota bacterium]